MNYFPPYLYWKKEYESNEIKDDDWNVFLDKNAGVLFPDTTLGC
jgi:hypothetical protein